MIEVPAGAILYQVTRREPFDATRFESERGTLREELLRERRGSHTRSILDHLRAVEQIELNPDWLDSLDSAG